MIGIGMGISLGASSGGGAVVPSADVNFGALTRAGEGGIATSEPNGTYGQFTVAGGVLTPNTSPLTVGTATVGATPVAVVANARTVSTVAQIAAITSGASAVPADTALRVRPGTYDLIATNFNGQAVNVTWAADKANDHPVFTHWGIAPSQASGGYLVFDGIDFNKPYPMTDWKVTGVQPSTINALLVGSGSGLTSLTIRNGQATGNLVPFVEGGRMSHDNPLVYCRNMPSFTLENYKVFRTRAGVLFDGVAVISVTGSVFSEQHADPIVFQNANGSITSALIANNHFERPTGDTSNHHYDVIQFQPTANGNTMSNFEICGNTLSAFNDPIIAQVDTSAVRTYNVFTSSFAVPDIEHGMETRLQPAGGMTVTLPPADTFGEQYSFRYISGGTGTVTFALNGSDTFLGGGAVPALTGSEQTLGFVSNGAGNWSRLPAGYRTWYLPRRGSFTAGSLENRFVTKLDATDANITMNLPDNGSQTFHVQREDGSGNVCLVLAAVGDTITLRGVPQTQVAFTQGYGLTLTGNGAGNWTAIEENPTATFIFGNAGDYSNINVHGNIILTHGDAVRLETEVAGLSVGNNTILRLLNDDMNGDGAIGDYEGNKGLTNQIQLSGATSRSYANATTGAINVGGYGAPGQDIGTVALGVTDISTTPASMLAHWAGTTRAAFRPVTRAQVIAAALVKVDGPLDGTMKGAAGTMATNGYYNFETGEVNTSVLPAPIVSVTSPANGASHNAAGQIVLTFDQFIEVGTGNIVIRNETTNAVHQTIAVGSATLTARTVAFTPSPALTDNSEYSIRFDAGIVTGHYGKPVAAVSDDSLLRFTADAGLASAFATVTHTGAYLERGAPASGTGTRDKGIFAARIFRSGGSSGIGAVINIDGATDAQISIRSTGALALVFGTARLECPSVVRTASPVSEVLISIDPLAATAALGVAIYVDGVLVNPTTYTAITWTGSTSVNLTAVSAQRVMAINPTTNILHGQTEYVYFDFPTTLPDLSDATVRAKFSPAQMIVTGQEGWSPSGAQPFLFMTGPASRWNAGSNYGYCGGFTATGTFTNV